MGGGKVTVVVIMGHYTLSELKIVFFLVFNPLHSTVSLSRNENSPDLRFLSEGVGSLLVYALRLDPREAGLSVY
jgi:hypothetical protein